jgi:thiol-disulfide isomerase/thioredoxin
MRASWVLATALCLAGGGVKAAAEDSVAALENEFDAALKQYIAEVDTARNAAKKNGDEAFKTYRPPAVGPGTKYSPRFLAIAEKNLEGPEAIEAIRLTLLSSFNPDFTPLETRAKALKLVRDHYVTSPKIAPLVEVITGFDSDDAVALVKAIIAKNPDRRIQVMAYKSQAKSFRTSVRIADKIKEGELKRESVERSEGKGAFERFLASGERARRELQQIEEILREKYADLVTDLSVGATMPELVSEDLEGKPAKLGDLKGKVVVLDLWATWCGPCIAMIPHEREMVNRLKDKPFALVSISVDAEKKTLTDFLAKQPMPWNHWWNGGEGKLIQTLDIHHYPTIFVLDPQGVIRYKEIRGQELEKAVDTLLNEISGKPTKAA